MDRLQKTVSLGREVNKEKKSRKESEYVRIWRGTYMKRSTARWLAKKEEERNKAILVIFGVVLGLAILSRCT